MRDTACWTPCGWAVRPLTAWRARNWTGKKGERALSPTSLGTVLYLPSSSAQTGRLFLATPRVSCSVNIFPHFRSWAWVRVPVEKGELPFLSPLPKHSAFCGLLLCHLRDGGTSDQWWGLRVKLSRLFARTQRSCSRILVERHTHTGSISRDLRHHRR